MELNTKMVEIDIQEERIPNPKDLPKEDKKIEAESESGIKHKDGKIDIQEETIPNPKEQLYNPKEEL